jgi:ABC-2 type transport system permease protein
MRDFLIKVLAFFAKEFHDVRRQPRLMLSLIGGPLLVLGAFGATFRSANPFVRTVLVWPAEGIPGVDQEQAVRFIEANFALTGVTSDEAEAMRMLEAGETDVVQIVPTVTAGAVTEGARPEIRWLSRTIDPNAEAWIRSLAYGEVNFINQQLLATEAVKAQEKAQEVSMSLDDALTSYQSFRESLDPAQIDDALATTGELSAVLGELLAFLPPEALAQANLSPELSRLYRDLRLLADDLAELETALKESDLPVQLDRLDSTIGEIETLKGTIATFTGVPAENIVTPIRETYTNLRGGAYSLVVFFAPSVLALLIQQMAVTLASLGLVRERQMGAFEMFRVAPLRFSQLLIGKTLAYVLFVTVAGILLTGLMALLKVPMPANILQFMVVLVLLALASVGIGFLISAVSRTDSQAIQLTMLLLLLSIFFTGFFLPITGFAWPAWIIALLIPMTSGIQSFQNLMLSGTNAGAANVFWLMVLAAVFFGLVMLIMRRQYRQVLD